MADTAALMEAIVKTLEKFENDLSKEGIIEFMRGVADRAAAGDFDDRHTGSNVLYIDFATGNRRS